MEEQIGLAEEQGRGRRILCRPVLLSKQVDIEP